jgi:hypothetical protein
MPPYNAGSDEMSALHVTRLTTERTRSDRPINRDSSCDFVATSLNVRTERNILAFRRLNRGDDGRLLQPASSPAVASEKGVS